MNHTYQIDFHEKIFSQSLLGPAAPRRLEVRKIPFSIGNGRNAPPQLHQLKQKFLRAALEQTTDATLARQFRGIADRAADLAWATPVPLLVFPCLFEEMAQIALCQFQRD